MVGFESHERRINDGPLYLCKVLIFAENPFEVAERLKAVAQTTIQTSCLNTIGMYPLVIKINTSEGRLCLSIWVINLSTRFASFREAYFSGAAHTIVFSEAQEEQENLASILRFVPQGIPTTVLTRDNGENELLDEQIILLSQNDQNLENRSLIFQRRYSDETSLNELFTEFGERIYHEISSGNFVTYSQQTTPQRAHLRLFDKQSFQAIKEIIEKLGYQIDSKGVVKINQGEFTFRIDFHRNNVKASISRCLTCDRLCKHSKKLCVIEEEKGYTNIGYAGNLKALAILYAINNETFITLSGEKKKEAISYQLQSLKNVFEINCAKLRTKVALKDKKRKKKKKN